MKVPTPTTRADVLVILPCKGRHEQTIEYATRLRRQAGDVAAHWAACGGEADSALLHELYLAGWEKVYSPGGYTYWEALSAASLRGTVNGASPPVLCAVSNDVWAGERWLERGLAAYVARFPDGEGLMGFSGDGHAVGHSCHFLIGRRLLAHLGGWPTRYQHNFGDTELCLRAQALGRYGKATGATLEHRHPIVTGAPDDAVYQAGRAGWDADQALFTARQARGWADAR